MQGIINKINSGVYILEIRLDKKIKLKHPKFLNFQLKTGFYYYVGSAQKNLSSRIQRHIRKSKKLHWHIDYLTSANETSVTKIFILSDADKKFETIIAENLTLQKYKIPLPGFGSSDDKKNQSHLFYSGRKIPQSHFSDLYQSIVCLIPSSVDISG